MAMQPDRNQGEMGKQLHFEHSYPCLDNAFSRIAVNVVRVVIASGSTLM